jgi:hypothetical protein
VVTRVPSYNVVGLRGAIFSNSAVTTGSTLTRVDATHFTFESTGIRRSFTNPDAVKLLDLTTSTSAPITVTGPSRNARTVSGGGITILDNLTSLSCTLNPAAVSWTTSCNCPTAGTWSGTCSDASTLSVAFSSTCGQATLTKGTDVSTITMDRCQ